MSTRAGGVSVAPYGSLNLGDHVGDTPAAVAENRLRLVQLAGLPRQPQWLSQVHGVRIVYLQADSPSGQQADGCWTTEANLPCAVLTADCLSALFVADDGLCVAAAHAGWRGLANGVLEATVQALPCAAQNLRVWLGPAIGPQAFQVGEDVRAAFVAKHPDDADAFVADGLRWRANLFALARARLNRLGVTDVQGGGVCTYADAARFFSHRRDGRSGRFASMIWRVG